MTYTTEQTNKIYTIVSYFNSVAGTRFKASVEKNKDAVWGMFTKANEDFGEVRTHINDYTQNEKNEKDLVKCCMMFKGVAATPVVATPVATAIAPVQNSIDTLGKFIMDFVGNMKMDEIQNTVSEKMHDDVRKFIADNYGTIERKVVINLNEKKTELSGVVHKKFDTVLKFVEANEPVFLTGAAGTGKNFLCQQIAKTLGLDFYFSNAVTQEYKLTGFTDAMGNFHESQFYKAFKNGGLFMLDEMDASIPEVLIILNAALANRYFDFPAPIGYVEAHPNFRVVAAGNTYGNGADYDYVGRSQLDAASLDRFALVRIDYDEEIEENCANGDKELLKFCRKFRKAVNDAGIRAVVSYRCISRMAKLSSCMEADELISTCLTKSLDNSDLLTIKDKLNGCGKYTDGFLKIIA